MSGPCRVITNETLLAVEREKARLAQAAVDDWTGRERERSAMLVLFLGMGSVIAVLLLWLLLVGD